MTDDEMIELAKEERRLYKREWYQKNKEHMQEYNRQYRKANAERIKKNEIKRLANKALKRIEAENQLKKEGA